MWNLFLLCLSANSIETIRFNCNFASFGVEFIGGNHYGCFAKDVDLGESTIVESVTGEHEEENSNDDVTYFRLTNQNVPHFPTGIEKFFPNLLHLRISATGMLSISAEDLQPYPQIIFLYIGANRFTSLDADLLSFTPNLQWINIDRCDIQSIGQGLLSNLNDLTYIDLQHNPCIDEIAENREEVLALMPKLSTFCPPKCTCEPRRSNYLRRSSKRVTLSVVSSIPHNRKPVESACLRDLAA